MRRRGRRIGHWSLFGVTTPSGGSQRTCRVGFRRATARYAVQHREVLAVISRACHRPGRTERCRSPTRDSRLASADRPFDIPRAVRAGRAPEPWQARCSLRPRRRQPGSRDRAGTRADPRRAAGATRARSCRRKGSTRSTLTRSIVLVMVVPMTRQRDMPKPAIADQCLVSAAWFSQRHASISHHNAR